MENRPVLKKIRRPINRAMPMTAAEPDNNVQVNEIPSSSVNQASNIEQRVSEHTGSTYNAPQKVNLPSVERFPERGRNDPYSYEEPEFTEDISFTDEDDYAVAKSGGVSMTALIASVIGCLIVGLLMGRFLFSETQVTHNGLQGVVANSEVPRGRARCGVADRTQGCVLYIMNPQRQNVRAKDFYDMAAQVTGRQKFMIETGNMRYANTEIRPGDIAQLNIPPL